MLRYEMTPARKATDSARPAADVFEELRLRFNAPQAWPIKRSGKDGPGYAAQAPDPRCCSPLLAGTSGTPGPSKPKGHPVSRPAEQGGRHLYPEGGDRPFTHPVPLSAVVMVDALGIESLAKMRPGIDLYQKRRRFRLPCGEDHGLVGFVDSRRACRRAHPSVCRNHRTVALNGVVLLPLGPHATDCCQPERGLWADQK